MKNSLSKCERAVLDFFQNSIISQISYTGLSDYTGFTRRAVIFAVQNLIEKNMIIKKRGKISNEYQYVQSIYSWKLDRTAKQVRHNRIRARRRAVGLASAKRTGATLLNCSEKDINVQMYRSPKYGVREDYGHWWVSRKGSDEKVLFKCYSGREGKKERRGDYRGVDRMIGSEGSSLLSNKVLTIQDIVNTTITDGDWDNIVSLIDKYVKQETDAIMLPRGITPYMRSWVGDKIENYSGLYWQYYGSLRKMLLEVMVSVKRAEAESKQRRSVANNGKAQKKLST